MYISVADIESYHKTHKNDKLNFSGQDERELEKALQESLKNMDKDDEEKKEPEEPKFKAF
jgi:hypothetical protein